MRVVVIGLGIQGRKRARMAGADLVATVDPLGSAQYRAIVDVALDSYDAALVCTPDDAKVEILRYLLSAGKHVLVEKPLSSAREADLLLLRELSASTGAACYTAYNHRFEPNIVRLKALVESGGLGELYLARLFYGNGTARDVRASPWRDKGLGVVSDLGSHLLDLVLFLFGRPEGSFQSWLLRGFENRAYDHAVIGSTASRPAFLLETSLLSWRNTFTIDVTAELGSAHLTGLRKWGPSTLTRRTRVFPSGRPVEEVTVSEGPDETWAAEYEHWKALCREGRTNIDDDIWINSVLLGLARSAAPPRLS